MDTVVKKSLAAPIKKLTNCVSGYKGRNIWTKHRSRRSKGGKRRSSMPRPVHIKDPALQRSYQADLEKERKLREAMNAQKNAERASMRAHFRTKYQLPKNRKDTSRLRTVGGKVTLPHNLAKMVRPDTPAKEDSYNLLNAFQGLSFNMGVITGTKTNKKTATPTPASAEQCKVM